MKHIKHAESLLAVEMAALAEKLEIVALAFAVSAQGTDAWVEVYNLAHGATALADEWLEEVLLRDFPIK